MDWEKISEEELTEEFKCKKIYRPYLHKKIRKK